MAKTLTEEVAGKKRDQVKQLLRERARSPEHASDPFWLSRMLSRYDNKMEME